MFGMFDWCGLVLPFVCWSVGVVCMWLWVRVCVVGLHVCVCVLWSLCVWVCLCALMLFVGWLFVCDCVVVCVWV